MRNNAGLGSGSLVLWTWIGGECIDCRFRKASILSNDVNIRWGEWFFTNWRAYRWWQTLIREVFFFYFSWFGFEKANQFRWSIIESSHNSWWIFANAYLHGTKYNAGLSLRTKIGLWSDVILFAIVSSRPDEEKSRSITQISNRQIGYEERHRKFGKLVQKVRRNREIAEKTSVVPGG